MLRFFRRNKKNRVRDVADRLLGDGDDAGLEQELRRFDADRLRGAERESWHHLWGVAAFRRGDRPEALLRFTNAYAACPESMEIRFSLGQELQHVGRVEEAFPLFDDCEFPSLSGAHAMVAARYGYLWGEFERSLAYLQPILAAYDQLSIVDDHFLYLRNLPFFGETWSTLGAIHELLGSLDTFFAYTERAARELREYDFGAVRAFASSVRSGDFQPVVDGLDARIIEWESSETPVGYAAMQRAVLLAVTTGSAGPHELLDSVSLTQRDFPWLDDLRILAHSAVANRESDSAREAGLLEAFSERQPLLFEPNHAFDFRLLRYQEGLRPAYQAACRARGSAA